MTCEPSNKLDCIDLNVCDAFKTSFFESVVVDYRFIMLPSNTDFDDFDVFLRMDNLIRLTISDYPYDYAHDRLIAKGEELEAIASQYDIVNFEYGADSR